MSDEALALAAAVDPQAMRMAMVSRIYADEGITVEVSEAELRRVHDEMDAALAAAQKVIDTVRALAGPNPSPVPQHLLTMMGLGVGYFRHSRDTLRKLFKARNAVRRERKKKGAKPC